MEPADLTHGPTKFGDATTSIYNVGEMGSTDLGNEPAKFDDATSAFCHKGEIEHADATSTLQHVGKMGPADLADGPAKFGSATSTFCYMGEIGPTGFGRRPTRYHTFIADPGHATSAGGVPSPKRH